MEEMETTKPFNILDVIKSFRKIIRGSVMKNDIKMDQGNDRMVVEGIVYFPAPTIALGSKER